MRRSLFVRSAGALGAGAAFGIPAFVRAAEPVRLGVLNIIVDAPFLIADKKGYFKEEGLVVQFSTFASSGNMVIPMSVGQLDAGGGAPSAGIYNGAASGVNVRVVADKGTDAPGYGFNPLLVRKELVASGKFKTSKDLRGLTVASNQPGSVSASSLFQLLKKFGMSLTDVHVLNLDYPDHVAALANGKIDASITAEPQATEAVHAGSAVRIAGNDTWYPNQQLSVLIFSNDFRTKRKEDATKFMHAYLRGSRFYYEALKGGHLAGPNAGEVIEILTQATSLKDPAIYREIHPNAVDPNGRLNLASMRRDLEYFRSQNIVTSPTIDVNDIIDESFVREAVAKLGPYKASRSRS